MRSTPVALTLTVLVFWSPPVVMAQAAGAKTAPASARPPETQAERPPLRVTFDDRPSLEIGSVARVDLRVTFQGDLRHADVPEALADPGFEWARRRVGVEGEVAGLFTFQVEREFASGEPWRDVYLDYRQFDAIGVRAGRFKMPFGLDENTSSARLDFVYRSRLADELSPGRDRGVMVHGRVLDRILEYEVGFFAGAGENTRRAQTTRVRGGRTSAARLVARPLRQQDSVLADLSLGVAATWSDVPEGFPTLRGQTAFGDEFYEPDYWVNGPERRFGLEARWRPGPFSMKAEYVRLTQDRRGQSVEDADLSPLIATGWYVGGTWAITGEEKAEGLQSPRRPVTEGGPGAIELAVRIESLEFGSGATGEAPSFSPRADVVFGNRLDVTTLGVTWHPMRWFRVQINFIRQSLEVPVDGLLPTRPSWGRVLRIQFAM